MTENIEVKNLTKYEKAQIIGARALQIASGAPIKAKLSEKDLEKLKFNPIEIAKFELEQGCMPLRTIRAMPKMSEYEDEELQAEKQEHL